MYSGWRAFRKGCSSLLWRTPLPNVPISTRQTSLRNSTAYTKVWPTSNQYRASRSHSLHAETLSCDRLMAFALPMCVDDDMVQVTIPAFTVMSVRSSPLSSWGTP
ncbi:hypothetical protein PISMIDRAFT_251489 [Pisolithus microcarpus 441]|uniref:Uncharacterized protein n=1 Tax=Pisolithus microcarpus 441 TaxID=765257 RepID=A0A0C9ZA26_9AGAM|nr:hypothetical protein PISMIDRAFT_251489 [Pisolithus microcarpus 441]